MSTKTRITEKEREAVVQSIKQGWTNDEIKAMYERTTGRKLTADLLYNMRVGVRVNPGYPVTRWRTMTDEEHEQVIKRIADGEMSQTQAETAYRADNGLIKQAFDDYFEKIKSAEQTAEQTTLYGEKSDDEDALETSIKQVETGDFPFTISVDKSGTKITCSGEDKYGHSVTVEVKTNKRLKIKFVR